MALVSRRFGNLDGSGGKMLREMGTLLLVAGAIRTSLEKVGAGLDERPKRVFRRK